MGVRPPTVADGRRRVPLLGATAGLFFFLGVTLW